MFFKRNKNQESTDVDVNQAQGKHETDTRYLVKLDNGQYVSKDYYDGTVNQGTSDLYNYYIYDLKDAKRTQRDFGGEIYEVVTDKCIRPYADGGITDQHVNGEAPIKTQEEIPEKTADLIKQLRNDGTLKPRVEADMTTDVRLDDELVKSINALTEALSAVPRHEGNADKEHQPKIHELPNQPLGVHKSDRVINYGWYNNDPQTIELLSKSNTRLAIIEDDTNA